MHYSPWRYANPEQISFLGYLALVGRVTQLGPPSREFKRASLVAIQLHRLPRDLASIDILDCSAGGRRPHGEWLRFTEVHSNKFVRIVIYIFGKDCIVGAGPPSGKVRDQQLDLLEVKATGAETRYSSTQPNELKFTELLCLVTPIILQNFGRSIASGSRGK